MSERLMSTRNYGLFKYNTGDNRLLDTEQHKALLESMKEYGFLKSFPISVIPGGNGKLVVKDGQHRLTFAEKLGLTVYYVEEKVNFDVAKVNLSTKIWIPKDYALKHAANGIKSYQEGLQFAEEHRLPIGIAFALLGGVTGYSTISDQFKAGTFKVKDRTWADAVAGIYVPLVKMSPALKRSSRLLEACMAVCRVPDFDSKRLLRGAELCPEKLKPYSTKEAYLDMLEETYNFRRQHLVGLKAAATMAMRDRSPMNLKNGNHKSAK